MNIIDKLNATAKDLECGLDLVHPYAVKNLTRVALLLREGAKEIRRLLIIKKAYEDLLEVKFEKDPWQSTIEELNKGDKDGI